MHHPHHPTKIILTFIAVIIFFIACFIAPNIYRLKTDKNYYGFPAITKCRVCDKTVWQWQLHGYKDYGDTSIVCVSDSSYVWVKVSGGGIVHKTCKNKITLPYSKVKIYNY